MMVILLVVSFWLWKLHRNNNPVAFTLILNLLKTQPVVTWCWYSTMFICSFMIQSVLRKNHLSFIGKISKTNISTSCRWWSSELIWQYTIKLFKTKNRALKSFIVYCQINSDDDQRQLVEILVIVMFINKTEICF